MTKHMTWFARYPLAAVCAFAAYEGAGLALQAYEFLVEAYRINAALMLASASIALLCACVSFLAGWRGGLLAMLLSVAAMLLLVVLGLWYMGDSLRQALFQASCAPGAAICFNQAAAVVRLCLALILGCLALAALQRYFLPMRSETLS
ncbi:hypothetical protein [Pseudoduganella rhizocola]|uniref:hypothetical protein n=1 Tax=Pseudoduganella rhizocola TaxID=3382643 RepID=UPI0038B4E2B9